MKMEYGENLLKKSLSSVMPGRARRRKGHFGSQNRRFFRLRVWPGRSIALASFFLISLIRVG